MTLYMPLDTTPKNASQHWMKAVRVHEFGGLNALTYEEMPRPEPGRGQALVCVGAAGVGPWDALIRSGKSELRQPLPLTPGSDFAGRIEAVGAGVAGYKPGDMVFGATNPQFTGAYAEYAVVNADMIAPKPARLSCVEAASVPVVAVTAWQMLFDYGGLVFDNGQEGNWKRIVVQGGAGSVGAYAVQLAKWAGAEVIATAHRKDADYVRFLGADQVIDVDSERFEDKVQNADLVLDTVGGDTLDRSFDALKPGGVLVSVVAKPDQDKAARYGVRGEFFYVAVTTRCLTQIADLIDNGLLLTQVGEVLPLMEARLAHEMLSGKPHKRGKIVLTTGTGCR